MSDTDPFDLVRFVAAQGDGVYEQALIEIGDGHKRSHWMWFVFPQLAGLGRSPMARRYAISSLAEARAYLDHQLLGPRLLACCDALHQLGGGSVQEIFGSIDAVKLRSSMTLFTRADPDAPAFERVLAEYFGGEADPATDQLLAAQH